MGEFLASLRENRIIIAAYGLQVTISLLVLGVLLVTVIIINRFVGQLRAMIEIHAFLEQNLAADDYIKIQDEIKAIEGVRSATYISAEQALENFIATTGIEIDSLLEDNPLPDSYVVKVRRIDDVTNVAEQVRRIQGIADVRFGKDVVVKLSRFFYIVQLVSGVTILLMLLGSFSSINNIVRLSIHARRREIRIMQLVGATKWFIRWPFLFEGMFVGAFGSILASLFVWAGYMGLTQLFEGLQIFKNVIPYDAFMITGVALSIIVLGTVIGLASSFNALSRYLAEDERIVIETARIRRELEWK